MENDWIAARMRDHLARAEWFSGIDGPLPHENPDVLLSGVLKLWPEPDEEFVRGLIRLLLGREADEAGMAFGLSLLRRGSRLLAVRSLAECEEARLRNVNVSWLSRLERQFPESFGARLRRRIRWVVGGSLRAASKVAAYGVRRLWQWSGNPLRDPVAELVAHARRGHQATGIAQASEPEQANSTRREPRESLQERRWFEVANQLDQMRRVCAALLSATGPAVAGPPMTLQLTPTSTPRRDSKCRICGGLLAFKWRRRVLNERYEAEYHECLRCAALQIPDPCWLAEAYREEDQPLFWNPDTGRFTRNFSVYCYLRAFRDSGVLAEQARLLDYGGGYGLLTQMLRDGGFDAWLADPYVARPYFSPERHVVDLRGLPAESFDAVTAFEVFEHLTDPCRVGEELRRLLRPDGVLVLSTGIYLPGVHGPDWHYLSTQMGQHVTFWSRRALSHLAARLGFRCVGYSPGADGFTVVFSAASLEELKARLARAAKLLKEPEFLGRATRCWELTHCDYFSISPEPLVEPARLCQTEVACAS